MAKITLIDPPLGLHERYGRFAIAGSILPPYSLLLLSSVLKREGYITQIIEPNLSKSTNNVEYIVNKIIEFETDYIGISATTLSINSAAILARVIKERFPNIKIIIGGCHISAIPEETMNEFGSFDIGVIGEGEETIKELISKIERNEDLSTVDGIIYRHNGKIKRNDSREFLANLDEIPFPDWGSLKGFPEKFHPVLHKAKRFPATHILTSRGCPNMCTFCDRSVFGNRCRFFSAEYVIDMIKLLYDKYNIREISIEDDTFLLHKKRLIKICSNIIKNDINISWTCNGRVDAVNYDTLKLMKESGCWQIGYGIESGSQKILDSCKKNITIEQTKNAVKLSHKIGIEAKGFFIIGFPEDTKDTIRETINLALNLPFSDVTVTKLTPFPGTEIYRKIDNYGNFEKDWKKMNLLETVFVPRKLTKKDIDRYQMMFIEKFYLRSEVIIRYFVRFIKYPKEIVRIFLSVISFIR